MRRRSTQTLIGQIVAALLILATLAPLRGNAVSAQSDGLTGDQGYESPQFGYEVSWDDPWSADERGTRTRADREDRLVLRDEGSGAELTIRGLFTEEAPRDVVDGLIADREDGEEDVTVEDQGRRGGRASTLISYTGSDGDVYEYVEVSEIDAGQNVLIVDLVASTGDFADAVDALAAIERDGDAVFQDEPAAPEGTNGGDPTVTPTEDDGSVRRRPNFPTDDPTEEPTAASDQEGVDGNTFTSPNFDFSVSWDPDIWTVDTTSIDRNGDQISLEARDGSLVLQGESSFGGDLEECVATITDSAAEGTDTVEVTDVEAFDDENGDPIEGSSRDSAYVANFYTATFQGSEEQFVYYVECRTLVEGESELVILQFVSNPDDYPDQAAAREDVVQSVETAESNGTDRRTPTPADDEPTATPDEGDETPVAGDGATFTSDAFGFSLSYDDNVWEESGSDDTGIGLDDGPSSLTIAASEDFDGDSVACVQGQLDQIRGLDGITRVEAEMGDDGRRVSGGDGERFYALYRVTASDGTFDGTNELLVYLECRTLEEGTSVISVTHLVFNPDQYEQESAKVEAVLETIEVGG